MSVARVDERDALDELGRSFPFFDDVHRGVNLALRARHYQVDAVISMLLWGLR